MCDELFESMFSKYVEEIDNRYHIKRTLSIEEYKNIDKDFLKIKLNRIEYLSNKVDNWYKLSQYLPISDK